MMHVENLAQYTVLGLGGCVINNNSMYTCGCINVLFQISKGIAHRKQDRLFCILELRAMCRCLGKGQISTQ